MSDEDTGDVYRFQHDFDAREELSTTLLLALDDVLDDEAPLLIDVLDPEALDGLFRPIMWRTDRSDGHVTFPIGDYHVTIHATGEIVIRSRESAE